MSVIISPLPSTSLSPFRLPATMQSFGPGVFRSSSGLHPYTSGCLPTPTLPYPHTPTPLPSPPPHARPRVPPCQSRQLPASSSLLVNIRPLCDTPQERARLNMVRHCTIQDLDYRLRKLQRTWMSRDTGHRWLRNRGMPAYKAGGLWKADASKKGGRAFIRDSHEECFHSLYAPRES